MGNVRAVVIRKQGLAGKVYYTTAVQGHGENTSDSHPVT